MSQLRPLYNLQQLDSKLAFLEAQAAQVDPGTELRRKLQSRQQKLTKLTEDRAALKLSLKDTELKLASVAAHVGEINKKLYSGKTRNPKELASFNLELKQLNGQKDVLETQALDLMEKLETQEGEMQKVERLVDAARKSVEEHEKLTADAQRQIEEQLQETRRRRDLLVRDIDATMLVRYDVLRKRKKGVAVVHMLGNACGECGANLPDSVRQRVRERHLELCSNCERILFTE